MPKKIDYPFDKNPERRQPAFYPIECAVLAFDLVGFTRRTAHAQMREYLETVHRVIDDVLFKEFNWNEDYAKSGEHNSLIMIPTGDGYCIAFIPGTDCRTILKVAVDLHKGMTQNDKISIRMGIATGVGMVEEDKNEMPNIFGFNINLATRIMNVAQPNQILLQEDFANLLKPHDIPGLVKLPKRYKIKHGQAIYIYNYFKRGEFGIPRPPKHN